MHNSMGRGHQKAFGEGERLADDFVVSGQANRIRS
jgi:hypothetical protein